MKNHVKVYFDYFGYDVTSFVPCEICGAKAVDINHVKPRGMGGSKKMDNIENLMAVCRECHIEYGDKKQHIDFLTQIHKDKCNSR
jgi:ribosome-binding protein aMBF1 (putative translation factor)